MPAIPVLLLTYWKPIALSLAIVALFVYRGMLIHQRDSARSSLAAVQSQLADFKSAEAACESAVARQNDAVAGLKAAADLAAATAQTRQANVTEAATAADGRETRHAAEIVNAPVAAGCAAAIKWSNAEAASLSKW